MRKVNILYFLTFHVIFTRTRRLGQPRPRRTFKQLTLLSVVEESARSLVHKMVARRAGVVATSPHRGRSHAVARTPLRISSRKRRSSFPEQLTCRAQRPVSNAKGHDHFLKHERL